MKLKRERQRVRLYKEKGRKGTEPYYVCDPIDQPGSPIVGRGDTPLEAILFLICQNEGINIEFIDDTHEVLDKNGVFPNGFNSRTQSR